ncbi:MAG: TRAP transporter small permease, partial [Ostreibacterium sp.]
ASMRYLFHSPTIWSLEVNGFLLPYIAVMVAADVHRRGEHISITLLPNRLGEKGNRIIAMIIGIIGLLFCAILAWKGYAMAYDTFSHDERVSSTLGTPYWLPYSVIPIGFTCLGLQFLIVAFQKAPLTAKNGNAGF